MVQEEGRRRGADVGGKEWRRGRVMVEEGEGVGREEEGKEMRCERRMGERER